MPKAKEFVSLSCHIIWREKHCHRKQRREIFSVLALCPMAFLFMNKYSPYSLSFEELTSFETLYKSHKIARLSKRHKGEIVDFELHLATSLANLEGRLKRGTYHISRYKKFYIYEPKEREIQALRYVDRVVQHSICDNFLTPYYSPRMIYANCACQIGKGTRFARMLFKRYLVEHYKKHGMAGYFLKCDVKKYFANINHALLKEQLKELPDQRVYKLLCNLIDSYHHKEGKGLPIGNQTSQIFGVIFLDKLDRFIKERLQIKHYVRYMDDLVMICEDGKKLTQILNILREKIKEFKLEFNAKTQIIPIKNGIEFLGGRYYIVENGRIVLKVKKQSKDRLKRNIKRVTTLQNKGAVDRQYIHGFFAGYNGHLKDFNAYHLLLKVKNLKRKSEGEDK